MYQAIGYDFISTISDLATYIDGQVGLCLEYCNPLFWNHITDAGNNSLILPNYAVK